MATRAVIVGGGVVGLAIAREIADLFTETYVLEKERRCGEHASSRNSGVIHAGIYYEPGSLKARLCVEGNRQLYEFCSKHNLLARKVGKLVVATEKKEEERLDALLAKSCANDVEDVNLFSGKEVASRFEENVHCIAALHVPSSGIIDTVAYLACLERLATEWGATIVKKTKVERITATSKRFQVYTSIDGRAQEPVFTDVLINAAGIFSDTIATRVNQRNQYQIIPVCGEAAKFYVTKPELNVSMNVYPTPQRFRMNTGEFTGTTGVHLSPTLAENGSLSTTVTVGPLLANPSGKENYVPSSMVEEFHQRVVPFFPHLRTEDLELHQAGISAKISGYSDFLIQRDHQYSHCIHLLGIDSPGLTSSLAIGKYVRRMITRELD